MQFSIYQNTLTHTHNSLCDKHLIVYSIMSSKIYILDTLLTGGDTYNGHFVVVSRKLQTLAFFKFYFGSIEDIV